MSTSKLIEALAFPPSPNWYLPTIASYKSPGYLSFGARNNVYILDIRTQRTLKVLQGHTNRVTGTAFVEDDSELIASCSADQSVILWNHSTGNIVEKMKDHSVRILVRYFRVEQFTNLIDFLSHRPR